MHLNIIAKYFCHYSLTLVTAANVAVTFILKINEVTMNYLELMQQNSSYVTSNLDMPNELQIKAKKLCHEYNNTLPDETEKRIEILSKLLGTSNDKVFIQPDFRCDYGFNIHFHGFAFVNYNVVMLDTSPINIGDGAFIAPGVCLGCAGHAILPEQRAQAIGTSAPITLEENVWLGANVTVCGGVTIGKGSVIGAGAVVTKDIPAGVIAVGNPCKVMREITDDDRLEVTKL